MHVEGLIPGISINVQPIVFMFSLRMFSNFSSYFGSKSLAMMTSSFSFGARNAYFKFSGSRFSSKKGGFIMDGSNLGTASVGLTSAPATCEKLYTTVSSYTMEIKSVKVA